MSIKALSRLLLGVGLTLIVFAIFKDVSHGGVYNFHKASQQSNQLILGGFIFLAGIVAMVASRSKGGRETGEEENASPQAEQSSPIQPTQPEFTGELDISSSPYQLFLTRQFSIEKNSTLEKYVIGDDVFDTLEHSLSEADRRYQAKLFDIKAEEERVRRAASELEQRQAIEYVERTKREEAEREDRQKSLKKAAIYIASGVALLGVVFLASKINDSRQLNKYIAEMEANERKRSERLGEMLSSGRLFGFNIGAENMNQLSDQLKIAPTANAAGSGQGIQCAASDCRLLTDFNLFEGLVSSVRFEFCPSTGNSKLTKIVLWYKNIQDTNADFESLNRRNRTENGIHISAESTSLSFSRPEVCQ